MRYTAGTPQLWKATYQTGRLLKRSNTASQDLDPVNRTVVNRAEYFEGQLYVTASGTYEPQVRHALGAGAGLQLSRG